MLCLILLLSVIACNPVIEEYDKHYGAGYIDVSEGSWSFKHSTLYPFTASSGEISCSYHPAFGRKVYFMPNGFTDESYIGTPLNKAASHFLNEYHMVPNVPCSIKRSADLSEAIEVGLRLCDEQREMLDSSER